MNRSVTNAVRFVLDECVPPIIRDSKWFMFPFFWVGYRGKLVDQAMNFKRLVSTMSAAEYAHFYQSIDTISRHRETDLNAKCVEAILAALPETPVRILDAGCGNGYLLRQIHAVRPAASLYGVDVKRPGSEIPGEFVEGALERLPFADGFFNVVICSHTLEHCVHLDKVIAELKRVAKSDLLVVVPKQRPYFYTVDEHVQFFYYPEQLTSAMACAHYECRNLGGDWFYHARVEKEKCKT